MGLESGLEDSGAASVQPSAVVEVEGIPLALEIKENWAAIRGFQAWPDDLLICTYPKAGTTWIQEIVDMVQHGGDLQKCARAPIFERSPYIELFPPKPIPSGLELAEAMPSPRTLKTHFPVQLLPPSFWKHNCKIIYVARNIKDNAVSFFHFQRMNKLLADPGKWEEFLENFIAGKIPYGSWFDHVRGWWEAKDRHPILYLFYEDMKEDPVHEIQKVAQFLGIELTESVLKHIVHHTTFESMKENPMTNYTTLPSSIFDHSVSSFMRKGKRKINSLQLLLFWLMPRARVISPFAVMFFLEGTVGNWKEHFTVAQSERLDDIYARELGNGSLNFRTQL